MLGAAQISNRLEVLVSAQVFETRIDISARGSARDQLGTQPGLVSREAVLGARSSSRDSELRSALFGISSGIDSGLAQLQAYL